VTVSTPSENQHLTTGGTATISDVARTPESEIEVAIFTGGFDRPYVHGLATELASKGVGLAVIGSDEIDCPEMHSTPRLKFLNLQGSKLETTVTAKVARLLLFYLRLIRYVTSARPRIFHILWNNKLQFFDRTLLMLYYKLLGKRVVFTAHNVNAGRRDRNDSFLNRVTLKAQYRLVDHIFVHTEQMKSELSTDFGIPCAKVTVIPFGLNNSVPSTTLTPASAKRRLGLEKGEKTILFFGAIRPYKGLQNLVSAFQILPHNQEPYRLIIAGEPKKGSDTYLRDIQQAIEKHSSKTRILRKLEFIPDEETELYFKAADVLVLPYTEVFQSGVLFLAYSFGLPVIASNVGSFREDIVSGETGYLARSSAGEDLAGAIEQFFASELYKSLDRRRSQIRDFARARNSWEIVGRQTCKVYGELLDCGR